LYVLLSVRNGEVVEVWRLLQAFKGIPSDEETTTDKDESDTDLSVDVDDADHDSQSEADILED